MTAAGPRERALAFLREHHVMTLATQGAEGPWAAAVFYAEHEVDAGGIRLVFLSSPTSRHGRALAQDARVAATIQRDYSEWPPIRGVQLEGDVRALEGDDETRGRALYGAKYPSVAHLARAPAAIVRALAKVRWYEIAVRRLYLIDNSLGFGHRDEIVPGDPA